MNGIVQIDKRYKRLGRQERNNNKRYKKLEQRKDESIRSDMQGIAKRSKRLGQKYKEQVRDIKDQNRNIRNR